MILNNIANEIKNSLLINGGERLEDFLYYMDVVCRENTKRFGMRPDWDNIYIKDKCYCGWLLPTTMHIETGVNGRWAYWHKVKAGKIAWEDSTAPMITMVSKDSETYEAVMKMINDCINFNASNEVDPNVLFLDWLLWSMGSTLISELPEDITAETMEYWYKTFKVEALLKFPAEYFSDLLGVKYINEGFNEENTIVDLTSIKVKTLHGYLYTPWTVEI